MIRPSPAWLTERPFAHRGLHAPGATRPENTLAAFRAARAGGFGIELDIQLSGDAVPVVFHDDDLQRLAGRADPVAALTAAELADVPLCGGTERIPTLATALAEIGSDTPLLIEIKADGPDYRQTAEAVAAVLQDGWPHAAVMSFHPGVQAWFAEAAPQRCRGQVAMEAARYPADFSGNRREALMEMLRLRVGQPDFLAYDIRNLPAALPDSYRHDGRTVLTWTVRTPAERARAAAAADNIIFEQAG